MTAISLPGRQAYGSMHVSLVQRDGAFLWVSNDRQLNSRADTILKVRGLSRDAVGHGFPWPGPGARRQV